MAPSSSAGSSSTVRFQKRRRPNNNNNNKGGGGDNDRMSTNKMYSKIKVFKAASSSSVNGGKNKSRFKRKDFQNAKKNKDNKKAQQQDSNNNNNFQLQLPCRRTSSSSLSFSYASSSFTTTDEIVPWMEQEYFFATADDDNNNNNNNNSNNEEGRSVNSSHSSLPCFAPMEEPSKNNKTNNRTTCTKIRLPTTDVPFHVMQTLNLEVQAFSSYVTLTQHECQTRQALIMQVERIAQNIFQNNNHVRFHNESSLDDNSESDNNEDKPSVHLKLFGSFATPQVCTFHSDIDLALFGAVDDDLPLERSRRQEQQERIVSVTTTLATAAPPLPAVPPVVDKKNNITIITKEVDESKKKKQRQQEHAERKQKWMDALAAMDFENEMTANPVEEGEVIIKDHHPVDAVNVAVQQEVEEAQQGPPPQEEDLGGSNHDDLPLFVLDRTGDGVLDEQQQHLKQYCDLKPVAAAVTERDETDTTNSNTTVTTTTGAQEEDSDNNVKKVAATTKVNGTDDSDCNNDDSDGYNSDDEAAAAAAGASDDDSADKLQPTGPNRTTSAQLKKMTLTSAVWIANRTAAQMGHVAYNSHKVGEEEEEEDEEYQSDGSSKANDNGHRSNYDDSDGDHHHHHDTMQVGFITAASATNRIHHHLPAKMSTYTRNKIVDALIRFKRGLCRAGIVETIQVIKNARVPIIKMKSASLGGIELDIAIGGQTGADTRLYASQQTLLYRSFAPVVLVLKVLLNQQDLDMPFTGGLGSYKLYVLVAHHIQQHLSLGGNDECGEILLSFLFRYGSRRVVGNHCVHPSTRTSLSQDDVIETSSTIHDGDGSSSVGCADLSNVYKLEECLHLFGCAWKRLWNRVRKTKSNNNSQNQQQPQHQPVNGSTGSVSLLAEFIDPYPLDQQRQRYISKAFGGAAAMTGRRRRGSDSLFPPPPPPPRQPQQQQQASAPPPGQFKNSNNKRKRSVSPSPNKKKKSKQQALSSSSSPSWPTEKTARQLVAGYTGTASSRSRKKQRR